jgi:serine/threonine-protein kinase HipA
MDNNALDYDLAKSVGIYFRLDENQMNAILDEVFTAVASWKEMAIKIGVPNREIELMEKAFNL